MPHTLKNSSFLSLPLRLLALSVAVSAALMSPLAMAQTEDSAEINRLMRAGQMKEALTKVDQLLASKPRDPQIRFLKGLILTESGKPIEAIATFTKLSEEYPELPEPYNNLAVLYAEQSQFDKARAALEMAIRTNPSYATAHENLGDVYAKLASQAYSKALQLDNGNAAVTPKLNLIRGLFDVDAKGVRPTTVAVATAPANTATTVKPSKDVSANSPTGSSSTASSSTTTAPPSDTADAPSAVESAVQAWAKAWSNKNMQGYLGSYAPNFTPPGGQSRSDWEADRKARIVPRNRISVALSDIKVSVTGDRATAKFRQAYSSDNLNTTSRKTLDLVKSGSRWLIVRETTGS